MCAAYRLEQGEYLSVYSVPAGQGKSRIIAGIVAALCQKSTLAGKKQFKHFHIIYNHQELLDSDRSFLENICDVSCATVRFSVPSEGLIQVGVRDEVTIIDEFDHVMLDRMTQFSKKIGASNRVIGLTATTEEDLNDFENSFLTDVRQFRLYNSMIEPSAADLVEPEFKTVE